MVSSGDQWAEWLTDYFAISWRLGESRCCDAQRCRFFAESVCVCVCVCVQTGRRGSRGLYVTCWSAFFFSPSLLRGGHDSLRRDWSPHPWYSPWYPRMLHIAADILWNMLFYVKIKWLFLMFMGRALSFIMQWFVLLRQGLMVSQADRQVLFVKSPCRKMFNWIQKNMPSTTCDCENQQTAFVGNYLNSPPVLPHWSFLP